MVTPLNIDDDFYLPKNAFLVVTNVSYCIQFIAAVAMTAKPTPYCLPFLIRAEV